MTFPDLSKPNPFGAALDEETIYEPMLYAIEKCGKLDFDARQDLDVGATPMGVNALERVLGRPHVYIVDK